MRSRLVPRGEVHRVVISLRCKLALRKREQEPVSQWVERHRIVAADSPVPGYWRNLTTPYLTGIMDAIMFPSVQEVVVCAPPQTGKTDLSLNIVGYTADKKPGNWLIVYPDEKTAGDMSRDRIQPMLKESPQLRRFITPAVDDLTHLKITLKHVRLYMAWATSASRLASRPLPYVLLDEIDKYPTVSNRKETGPVELARKRTRTFGHMRKIIRVSTPTIVNGPVWQALETECEAVFNYWVKCPLCGHDHLMDFKSITWEDRAAADPRMVLSDPKSTWYICPGCGERWDDARRDQAVAVGEWRDRVENIGLVEYLTSRRPVVIGFHYKAWISRFVPLREAAAAFIRGLSDPIKLRDFQNDYNAEPWLAHAAARPQDPILQLIEDRPRGVVPSEQPIAGITAGIDTQDDGFWYWIHAWGLAEPGQRPRSWCVRAGFVLTFDDLAQVLWEDAHRDITGKQYVIEMALQDSAGHRTSEVYDFARAHPGRLFPALGRKTMNSPYRWNPQTHYPGAKRAITGRALQLLNVNTKYWKDEAAAALQVGPGDPGGIGLYAAFPAEYVAHLVAEYVGEDGFWECPSSRANHLWDCLVLNFVAAEVRGVRHRGRPAAPVGAPAAGGRRVISRGVEI